MEMVVRRDGREQFIAVTLDARMPRSWPRMLVIF
jgi:hypothetical protein